MYAHLWDIVVDGRVALARLAATNVSMKVRAADGVCLLELEPTTAVTAKSLGEHHVVILSRNQDAGLICMNPKSICGNIYMR
jgi:hypothetical protein